MATAPGRPGEQNPAYAPPSAHPEYEAKEPEELTLPREGGGVPGAAGGGGRREVGGVPGAAGGGGRREVGGVPGAAGGGGRREVGGVPGAAGGGGRREVGG